MTSYTSLGGDSSSSSPSTPSHATWLRRASTEGEAWPDLLVDRRSLQERREVGGSTDPAATERSNLVALTQLVVKAVVDQSLRFGRQVDQDSPCLHQLFVLVELALRHGLRPRRLALLQGRRDLWELLQTVARWEGAATEITSTARDLSVRTPGGRARAWLRLATMQKKLGDYVKGLVERREVLAEYYEPEALMVSEEGHLLAGLLTSLNIVDCNLWLREEELDNQETVIDLSQYLRRKEDIGREEEVGEVEERDITTVIDQKNYIEEMNRNLAANVTNLSARVETLTNTNALMREDLAISKRKAASLEQEQEGLRAEVERQESLASLARAAQAVDKVADMEPSAVSEAAEEVERERRGRREVERELELEVAMKAEMEMAMKLLEKDVHEKQDTIVSLRAQLQDIKAIHLEVVTKLAECERSLTYKSDMVQRLETKCLGLGETLQELDTRYLESELAREQGKAAIQELQGRVEEAEGQAGEAAGDARIEREWRERLQEASMADREGLATARQELEFLRQVQRDYDSLRQENAKLREQAREGEQTLEELGQQLSWSKLQVDSMKETASPGGAWTKDSEASACTSCSREFGLARRKHHCRSCGGIFCDTCSDNKMQLPSSARPVRVCDSCYTLLINKQSKVL